MSPLPAGPGSGLSEPLTIRSVDDMLVTAPMRRSLGTSAMRITEAPLVLVDLQTEEGITSRAYLVCYLESAGCAAIALTRDVSAVLTGTAAAPAAVRAGSCVRPSDRPGTGPVWNADAVSHFRRGQTSMSMASLVRGPLLRIPLAAPGEKLL